MLVSVVLLSGCAVIPAASEPEPSATPTTPALEPTPEPTPSPTATADPLASVAMFVARPTALELRDASGELVVSLEYLDDVGPAIATVERLLGAEAETEEYQASNHYPAATLHRWGAFEILERRYVDGWARFSEEERTLGKPAFGVTFTGPEESGFDLTTEQGVHAGAEWADLMAMPEVQTNPNGCNGPYLDFIGKDVTWPDGTAHVQKYAVDFRPSDDRNSIGRVTAPVPVYEDGCA
ncbi:hypothetical protein ASE68_12935 [Agromyces sp. Leaf222]|nr:hypothetical protein ASE68_12935 [Agromyces sp. Leaf222]